MSLEVILSVLWSASFIGLVVSSYILWRNDKVLDFRLKIIEAFLSANRRGIKNPLEKYSYEDMLYSIKPLKLEAWFTEEEIKILKGESNAYKT